MALFQPRNAPLPPAKDDDLPNLFEHVILGHSEEALELTCHLLREGDIHVLEAALIRLCARFGEGARAPHPFAVAQWRALCADVARMLERAKWPVKEAVVVVAKLCILFRTAGVPAPRPSIVKLRALIIDLFPDDAQLTDRGREVYAAVLPDADDERAFAERLLVGLLRLWSAKRPADDPHTDLLHATDYLLRKKQLVLHLPQADWPCPSIDEYDRGDMVWFLWGAWMIRVPETRALWRLFSHGYKRSLKTERMGLLMGARWWMAEAPEGGVEAWSQSEQALFAQVENYAVEMWRALRVAAAPEKQARDHVWDYLPRGGSVASRHEAQEVAAVVADMKKVTISKARGPRDGPLIAFDHIENLDSAMIVDYETVRHRSRHRRVNVGEAWE